MPGASEAQASGDAATRSLARLRADDREALTSLVDQVVDFALTRPVTELLGMGSWADPLASAIQQAAATDPSWRPPAQAWLAQQLEDERPLRDRLPEGIPAIAEPVLAVPWTPSERLVLQLLKHDAARDLIRETLANTLQSFATRARSLDEGVLKGIGGRAFQRGKGLLGQMGSAAEGLVGAVSKEVEHALESRISGFLGGATDDALQGIAVWLADPRHAEPLAKMRLSAYHQVLDSPPRDLLGSATGDVDVWVDALREGLDGLARRPQLARDLAQVLDELARPLEGVVLRDWVPPEAQDALRELVRATVQPPLQQVIHSDAFGQWWEQLHR